MSTESQNLSREMILRAYKALHLSRVLYKSTLFMQNKPNFRKVKMNLNFYPTKDYENKSNWNLAKTKPIQTQYKAKTNPISSKAKMNANAFSQKDYENETAFRPQKNKPNQTQFQIDDFLGIFHLATTAFYLKF